MGPNDLVHPDVAEAVAALAIPPLDDELIAAIRSFDLPPVSAEGVVVSEHVVPGEPAIELRIHRPEGATDALPCVYSMHGGGYVIGSTTMDDGIFAELCPRLGLVGVSVEYRLAPETPYPGPLEDCYRGLEWIHRHAAELGIDTARIGVAGISAGGGLAAALALLARDRGELAVAFQLLDSPMLDDRQLTGSSQWDDLLVWPRESNTFGWRSYLGELYGRPDVPYTAAPARAGDEDLAGLPPAFVSVGAVDGFLDEDVEYARRLNHAGVPTELHVYPGACHGYQIATGSDVARQSRRDVEHWLARRISR